MKVEENREQRLFVAVDSLFVTCTWPQRVTFTPFVASFCANLDLSHAFSPLPLPEYDNRKHSPVSVATASRDTHVSQDSAIAAWCPSKRQVLRSTSMPRAAAPNKRSLCPLVTFARLCQNQQGSIPAALGNRTGQGRIGWAVPTFCAPLACTAGGCISKGPGF